MLHTDLLPGEKKKQFRQHESDRQSVEITLESIFMTNVKPLGGSS